MTLVNRITGNARKVEVKQDEEGQVISGPGVLFTKNLFNCMALVIRRGQSIGMIHVSPGHERHSHFVKDLIKRVTAAGSGDFEVLIAGGNGGHFPKESTELADAFYAKLRGLAPLTVLDGTSKQWVAMDSKTDVSPGGRMLGFVAASAATAEFQISGLVPDEYLAPAPRRDNGCTIL